MGESTELREEKAYSALVCALVSIDLKRWADTPIVVPYFKLFPLRKIACFSIELSTENVVKQIHTFLVSYLACLSAMPIFVDIL